MTSAALVRFCLGLGLCLGVAGCGPRLAVVTGKVVAPDNTSYAGGTVVFNPVDENPFAAQGLIQPDGTFRLGTTRPGEGAIPGKYRVLIEPSGEEGVNAETSEPEFTVVAGMNHFTITAQKPEKKKTRNKN